MENINNSPREKTVWELDPQGLASLLKETIPEEIALIEKEKEKRKGDPDTVLALNAFAGLVEPLTRIAIDQISNPSGLSWEQASPEGSTALRIYLNNIIPKLQESNPAIADSFRLAEQELLALPGGDQDRLDKTANKLGGKAWEGYSNGKPLILFPRDNMWVGIMCAGREPSWDARAILMLPISSAEQIVIKDWANQVVDLYQQKFPDRDLKQLKQIHLFVGENIAHAGTEIASHTAGESQVNGVMIDLNGCYPMEKNLTELEIMGLYTRVMVAHELAHEVQKIVMGDTYKELEEWMCDVLACRAIADYINQDQFDEDKQQELMTALETQTKLEFAANGVENRKNSIIRGYRASCLWLMEARKNNSDLKSWKAHLDKAIASLWDPGSEEARLALTLEEMDAQKG